MTKTTKSDDINILKKNRQNLEKIISIVYISELMNEPIDIDQVFELYNLNSNELKKLKAINKNYKVFKNNILVFIKQGWNWNRISPLIRAILIVGSFELIINYKTLVINEMIEITKIFTLDTDKDYKFVNSILDKISKTYEKETIKKTD